MKNKLISLLLVLGLMGGIAGALLLYNYLGDKANTNSLVSNESFTGEQTGENAASTKNNPAPDFTVTDMDGKEVSLSDFRGKPVILNFWASWCGPCKSEMPDFDTAYKNYKENVHFLIVNLTDGYQETVDSASSFIQKQGYSFPVYYDTLSEAANTYQVYSIPATYFIDAKGNLIAQAKGAINADTLQKGIDMIYTP